MFWLPAAGRKNWFHPFQKALKVREVIEKGNKPVFKGKILIKVSLTRVFKVRIIFQINCMCHMSARVKSAIFSQHKNGSDLPLSFHANYTLNPASLHTSSNSFIQNQSSTLPRYLPITVSDNSEGEGSTHRRFVTSSRQTPHFSSQNDSLVPLFVTDVVWVFKAHLRESNSQKARSAKSIFHLKPRKIPILSSHGSIEAYDTLIMITTDQLLWRHKTYFRGALM